MTDPQPGDMAVIAEAVSGGPLVIGDVVLVGRSRRGEYGRQDLVEVTSLRTGSHGPWPSGWLKPLPEQQ